MAVTLGRKDRFHCLSLKALNVYDFHTIQAGGRPNVPLTAAMRAWRNSRRLYRRAFCTGLRA